MLVTPSEIAMLAKEEHIPKAPSPMLVTLSGMVMLAKEEHQ